MSKTPSKFDLVYMLRRSVPEWNAWRKEHPHVEVDLSDASLCGVDLAGADLSGVNLTRASLKGSNLIGAILVGTDFDNADFSDTKITASDLVRAKNVEYANLGVDRFLEVLAAGYEDPTMQLLEDRYKVAMEIGSKLKKTEE